MKKEEFSLKKTKKFLHLRICSLGFLLMSMKKSDNLHQTKPEKNVLRTVLINFAEHF